MKATPVNQLVKGLQRDDFRVSTPFSEDIVDANRVILNPYAWDSEKSEALSLWLRSYQPCIFGRLAAKDRRKHICILSDHELDQPDNRIRQKIQNHVLRWKRRSIVNENPAHGFMLVAASARILNAAPDQNLRALATRLRQLWGCKITTDAEGNDVGWETLFLQNPNNKKEFLRFSFSLDYFGSQGDGRWWSDHRIPGGIGFTANSLGHMAWNREWYGGLGPQVEWAVKNAMLTVDAARNTEWGKAIWLENLVDGKTYRGDKCPFENRAIIPERLRDKDWSCYGGRLSTDHSIREELFRPGPAPQGLDKSWIQDFTYIYDPNEPDQKKFMQGEAVEDSEVYAEIGAPETWRVKPLRGHTPNRLEKQRQEIAQLLQGMEKKAIELETVENKQPIC